MVIQNQEETSLTKVQVTATISKVGFKYFFRYKVRGVQYECTAYIRNE
jgi:hypothetical protein